MKNGTKIHKYDATTIQKLALEDVEVVGTPAFQNSLSTVCEVAVNKYTADQNLFNAMICLY